MTQYALQGMGAPGVAPRIKLAYSGPVIPIWTRSVRCARARGRLPTYRAQVPAAVQFEVYFDRSISIRASVEDVKVTLSIAIALAQLESRHLG